MWHPPTCLPPSRRGPLLPPFLPPSLPHGVAPTLPHGMAPSLPSLCHTGLQVCASSSSITTSSAWCSYGGSHSPTAAMHPAVSGEPLMSCRCSTQSCWMPKYYAQGKAANTCPCLSRINGGRKLLCPVRYAPTPHKHTLFTSGR